MRLDNVVASYVAGVQLGGPYHLFQVGYELIYWLTVRVGCDPIQWHTFNSKAFVMAPSSWSLWNPNSELQVEDRKHTGVSVIVGGNQICYRRPSKKNAWYGKEAPGTIRATYRLTCQFQASSVSLVLLASESPLRFQSLFPTPFSPRHYQQRRGSVQQQRQRLWATLRTISCRRNRTINGTEQLRRNAKTTNVLHTSPGLKRGVAYFLPNPQGNDPFKSSTLLIVHRDTACIPVEIYTWSWHNVGFQEWLLLIISKTSLAIGSKLL